MLRARSTSATGHSPIAANLFDRGDQVSVVVEIADDRFADSEPLVVGLEGELPEEVVGQRGRGREGVLDGRLTFREVGQTIAEKYRNRRRPRRRLYRLAAGRSRLLLLLLLLGRLQLLVAPRQRILHHLLVGRSASPASVRHRQQLDRLLQ